ncbi:putative beta-mannosidase [Toxocara canis]|uniref:beta-mannosidase n=1 Tax=Toxocara canis TaxID=6265 RepID=A0A0B2VH73_TOXCA|nr:putative beta-mannosidase [Toxocara canis]
MRILIRNSRQTRLSCDTSFQSTRFVSSMLLAVVFLIAVGLLRVYTYRNENSTNAHLDLSANSWMFRSRNGSISGKAMVPGDIFTDLFRSRLIPEPLSSNNDQRLRWVAVTEWIYETTFHLDKTWAKYKCIVLNIQGLDTVAIVYLNGAQVVRTHNQFLSYLIPLEIWRLGDNNLTIQFESPVHYSTKRADNYHARTHHDVPPTCPPEVYHGECHANFIRKIQASFSWDWGPAFPTVGIWQPISLEGINTVLFERISATIKAEGENFLVSVELNLFSAIKSNDLQGSISIPELSMWASFKDRLIGLRMNRVFVHLSVPSKSVELWWPKGYGDQRLYLLEASVTLNGEYVRAKPIKIGFRTIDLLQDLVDFENPGKGRNFFFKINNIPIFLKGSNWIPISSFPAQNHSARMEFLLKSTIGANMNTLRVWGGGRYESDTFYEMADEMGILIWHDLMFACALYPTDATFLNTVRKEVTAQIRRLRHHASILLWAANNENELGIQAGWWPTANYPKDAMVKDYIMLYKDTIEPIVLQLDDSRPFLLSSPSNGIETEKQGGIAMNPGDPKYGDIHFYNEFVDLWKDHVYQIPRCATEYGVQSFPRKETLLHYLNQSEWYYTSRELIARQHHPGGVFSLITMIFSHFPIPAECSPHGTVDLHECTFLNSSTFLDRFVFYTQMHQAIAYQTQTEHYRRWRGILNEDGEGNTMCALYWQLNDVWAAPTWSSIDYDLSWKPAHYFAKRFFDNIIVSMYIDDEHNLRVFIVSDSVNTLHNCTLIVDMLAWTNGFVPVYSETRTTDVPALTSISLDMFSLTFNELIKKVIKSDEEFIMRGRLMRSDGFQIGYDSVLHPDQIYKVEIHRR